ncbi:hypothetical protein FRX31_027814 [Thalictrum thalictroides]|uniref:Uncharacterized protein n=1 Tax=Thalictrum thalictroides TaxID=46969 RepID=A0A7J6VBY5_THATH|nr:hypothetical protein FRX31_027814 [Thalictrum thalictroides]
MPVSIWVPPTATILKLNVDITFKCPTENCGIGFILRDSTGKFIMAGTETTCADQQNAVECLVPFSCAWGKDIQKNRTGN